jgi:PAS domain S-box-containing protein
MGETVCRTTQPAATDPPRAAEAAFLLAAIVESSEDAIISKDLSGVVTTWNNAAERMFGYKAEEMVGAPMLRLFPEERRAEEEEILAHLKTGEQLKNVETVRLARDATLLHVSMTASPIKDAKGNIVGVSSIMRDISERKRADAELRQSEQFNRSLVDSSRDCLELLSTDGRLLWISDEGQRMLCISELRDVLGASWLEFWHQQDRAMAQGALDSALAGKPGHFVAQYSIQGNSKWFDVLVSRVLGSDGKPEKLLASSRDVTSRKQAEEMMQQFASQSERERRVYEAILSSTPDLVYVFDLNHRFTYANTALLQMWGRTRAEALGKNCLELGYPAWHSEMHDREIEQVIATKLPIRSEVPFTGTHGRRIYEYIFVPVLGETGQVEAVAGTTRDVTERKQGEESLRQSEERFRALVTTSSDVIYTITPDWSRIRPLKGAQFIPETDSPPFEWLRKHIPLDDQPRVMKAIHEAIRLKGNFEMEHRAILNNGSTRWMFSRAAPLLDAHGTIIEWFGAARDVTERKETEEALRRSEQQLALVSNTVPALISYVDTEFRYLFCNRACTEWFGLPAEQIVGRSMLEVLGDTAFQDVEAQIRATLAGETAEFETKAQYTRGGTRWIHATYTPHFDGDGKVIGLVSLVLDVTARKAAEEAFRESQAVLQTVTNEAQVGLVMVDQNRRYLFANQTYADVLGLPEINIVGQRVCDVIPQLYNQVQPNLDRAFTGERVTYELYMARNPRSGEECYYEVVYEPRSDSGGKRYVIVVLIDITQRKKVEHTLEKIVAQRTASLSETVGELEAFSYTIAHDMRAPLRAMQSFSAMLEEDHADRLDDQGKGLLRRIGLSANRLDSLIQDVLNYSKIVRADLKLEPVDTHSLIHEITQSYPNLQPEKADIFIPTPLPAVLGNRAALTQAIANLLGNATKFVAPGVRPRIHVTAQPAKNGFVRLMFEDNGIGIEASAQNGLFQMFHRAHNPRAYEGTGMGLAIVRKAVERMGGSVGVDSQPGNGSRFWIELKLAPL